MVTKEGNKQVVEEEKITMNKTLGKNPKSHYTARFFFCDVTQLRSLSFTFVLFGQRGGNLLVLALGNVEEDARRFHAGVDGRGRVWDVADVVASALQLHDVPLLEMAQMRIAQHLELHFRVFTQEILEVVVLLQNSCRWRESGMELRQAGR